MEMHQEKPKLENPRFYSVWLASRKFATFRSLIFSVSICMFAAIPEVMAKLPEVDAVYYGRLFHEDTTPLFSSAEQAITLIAEVEGTEIAQFALPVNGSNSYRLNIPMDDGQDPRIPGAARAGETLRIFLKNGSVANSKVQVQETTITPFALSSERGDVERTDLSVAISITTVTGTDAAYEAWLASFPSPPENFGNPGVDSDGDGVEDFDEFIAGSDPLDSSDKLVVKIENRDEINNVSTLRYGPVTAGRRYQILCCSDLENWTEVNTEPIIPEESAESALYDHVTDSTSMFYILEVSID